MYNCTSDSPLDQPRLGGDPRRLRRFGRNVSTLAFDNCRHRWRSYHYDGGIWALPIDVAAQTAAFRQDLLNRLGVAPPSTLDGAIELARTARTRGLWMAWPAKPTDLFCTLMSLAASRGDPVGTQGDAFIATELALEIIERMRELLTVAHPQSRVWNPIQALDAMSQGDEIAYMPFTFNYVNYATHPERPIRFSSPPALDTGSRSCGLLGGAGIGISAKSADPQAAFDYAMYLCSREVQAGPYVREGGQPGSRAAWRSPEANELVAGFFLDTLAAMESSLLRPTHPGFIPFFHEATGRLAQVVHEGESPAGFVSWMSDRYTRLLPKMHEEAT